MTGDRPGQKNVRTTGETVARINWAVIDDIAKLMLGGGATREAMIAAADALPGGGQTPRIKLIESAVRARLLRKLVDERGQSEILLKGDGGPPYVVVIRCQYDTDGDQQTADWTTTLVAGSLADADAIAKAINAHAKTLGRGIDWRVTASREYAPELSADYSHGDMRIRRPDEPASDLAFAVEAWAWCHYDGELSNAWKAGLTEERKAEYRDYADGEGWNERGPSDFDDEAEDDDLTDDDDDLTDDDLIAAARVARLEADEDDADEDGRDAEAAADRLIDELEK